MELLERAALVAKRDGQPVEQFRMRGRGAHVSEVVGGIHESGAEVILPDAIDDGAPRQHVVAGGDPVGQGGAARAFGFAILQREARRQPGHAGKRSGTDRLAGTFHAAALQHGNRAGLDGEVERALGVKEIGRGVDQLRLAQLLEVLVEGLQFGGEAGDAVARLGAQEGLHHGFAVRRELVDARLQFGLPGLGEIELQRGERVVELLQFGAGDAGDLVLQGAQLRHQRAALFE